jgi:hypothetical protein
MRSAPDWPRRLLDWQWPDGPESAQGGPVGFVRKLVGMPALKRAILKDICGSALGGTRFDTWVCNLALPFVAAGRGGDGPELFGLWRVWYPGDAPVQLLDASKRIRADGAGEPDSNGLIQGLLAQQFERAAR